MKTLFYNGNIYTMKHENDRVEAVLVEDGWIVDVGSYDSLKDLATEQVDLQGKTMLPGFTDVHMHMVMTGKMLRILTLDTFDDIEDIKKAIQEYSGDLEWDLILGYNEKNLKDNYKISRQELDEITDKPTLITRIDYHAGVANSEALKKAGIDKDTEDPEGGYYERDENGELTGWVYDKAFEHMRAMSVTDTTESIGNDLVSVSDHLISYGFTSAHTEDMAYYGDYQRVLNAYYNTFGKDKKKFRVRLLQHEEVYSEMRLDDPKEVKDWIEFDAMKIFQDGTLGSETALMNEPYVGTDNTGLQIHTQANLEEIVQRARIHDDAIAVHIIGDKACDMVLTAIEKYPVVKGKHDRLIHVSVLSDDLIERMSKLDVVCDIQPPFLFSDMPWSGEILGPERTKYLYPFKTLQDKGLILGGSSDAPIESVDPVKGIYILETRDDNGSVYNESEKLTRFDAVSCYTKNAAKIVYKDNIQGQIDKGFYADFVLFEKDIMTVDASELLGMRCSDVYIDGTHVYNKSK